MGLLRFVAFLSGEGVSYPSIRVYLSGLRFVQIMSGLQDPALSSFSRLEYILRGVRRLSPSLRRPQRLPITPQVLRMLFKVWSQPPVLHNSVLLWAARAVPVFSDSFGQVSSLALRWVHIPLPCYRWAMWRWTPMHTHRW